MTDWNSIVRGSLIGLEPYRPGASLDELKEAYGLDEIVKLNWNEGLEGPFPGVEEAVVAELDRAWIYPAEAYSGLRESVAAWLGTPPERIVPSHGIQALVGTVAHAFLDPGDAVVLTPRRTGSTRPPARPPGPAWSRCRTATCATTSTRSRRRRASTARGSSGSATPTTPPAPWSRRTSGSACSPACRSAAPSSSTKPTSSTSTRAQG